LNPPAGSYPSHLLLGQARCAYVHAIHQIRGTGKYLTEAVDTVRLSAALAL
jgi:hypothetical protein